MERYQLEPDVNGKCGIGIVIVNKTFRHPNLKTRDGAEQEMEYLEKLLREEFSLEVYVYKNMEFLEMRQLLASLLSGKRGLKCSPQIEKKHQTLAMAISSHGTERGIYTADAKILNFNRIKSLFNSESCEFLINKPKMFIFNCCRTLDDGQDREETAYPLPQVQIETDGLISDAESDLDPRLRVASSWSDFITVNFCVRGTVSLRSTDSGSLAIKEFYQGFRSYGRTMDFQSFMTRFTREVKIKIYQIMQSHKDTPVTQCPEVITTLDRLLCFPSIPTPLGEGKSRSESQELHHASKPESNPEDHTLAASKESSQHLRLSSQNKENL